MTKYKRLKELCRTVWSLLTEEERERYLYDTGTIGFIEDVAKILDLEVEDLLVELLDDILNQM